MYNGVPAHGSVVRVEWSHTIALSGSLGIPGVWAAPIIRALWISALPCRELGVGVLQKLRMKTEEENRVHTEIEMFLKKQQQVSRPGV